MLKTTDTIYGWITKLSWCFVWLVFLILVIFGIMNKIPIYLRLAPDALNNTAKVFIGALTTLMAVMSSIVVALVATQSITPQKKIALWRSKLAPYFRYFFVVIIFNLALFIFSDQLRYLNLGEALLFLAVAFNVYAFFLIIKVAQGYLDENSPEIKN